MVYKGFQGIIVVFVLCFRSQRRISEKVNYRQKEKAVLDEILGHGYDKRIRPSGKNDTGKTIPNAVVPNLVMRYHEWVAGCIV